MPNYKEVKDSFCVLPFTHLATHPAGRVTPCCESNLLAKENGKELNLNTHTVEEIRDSSSFKRLRNDMLNGVKNSACNFCYIREEKGLDSKRNRENRRYNFNEETYQKYINNPLISVELRLGNTCNLKCLICNPWSSSRWNEDAEVAGYDKVTIQREWFKETNVYDGILRSKDDVEHLWFNGGEPTLIKEHYYLLEEFIKRGRSKNVWLEYHTNGTNLPDKLINLWKEFKFVTVTLSIDDIEDRLYYQRFPSKHDDVVRNAKKLVENGIDITVIPSISLYNVYNIHNLYDFYKTEFNKEIELINFVSRPKHLSVTNLPEQKKKELIDFYRTTLLPEKYIIEIEYNLFTQESKGLEKFINFTKSLDNHRKVSILDYLPEYAEYF
tara:strand:- start:708 stop:1856 length:1149 start_codon:yes stop_codon:yes gene_type:complete